MSAADASRENGLLGGRPPGSKSWTTLVKEEAREAARLIITAQMDRMLAAQILHAQGIKHLMVRDPKTQQFERVKVNHDADPAVQEAQIDAALSSGGAFWIFTKDPSVQAFTDLMNRAIDKPQEPTQQHEHTGTFVMRHELIDAD